MKSITIIIGILALIVVGGVGISIVTDVTSTSDWEYDDYREAGDAVDASGSLEIVDTYLGKMIHAHDVGAGIIQYPDRTEEVMVQRAQLDVFFMTGQSNSVYRDVNPSQADPLPPLGEAYVWANTAGEYGRQATSTPDTVLPMRNLDGTTATADKAPAFAAEYTELTDRKVFFVCGGWSGKSITYFDPSGSQVWAYMQRTVEAAKAALDDDLFEVRTLYWMWIQGESDASRDIQQYKDIFMDLNTAINDGELGGWKFSHCFISLIRSEDGGNAREAQIQLAQEHPDLITIATDVAETFTVENGLMMADNLHYSQLGDNLIGEALGQACAERAPEPKDPFNQTLLGILPILMILSVAVMCIGLALRALMGRD